MAVGAAPVVRALTLLPAPGPAPLYLQRPGSSLPQQEGRHGGDSVRGVGGARGGPGRSRTRTRATAARALPHKRPPPGLRGPITGRDRSRKGRRPLRAHRHLSTRPLGCGPRAGVLRVRRRLPRLRARLEAASPGEAASRWWVVRAGPGARRGGHRVTAVLLRGPPPAAVRMGDPGACSVPSPGAQTSDGAGASLAPAERPRVRWARSPSARCQVRAARRASPGAASLRRARAPGSGVRGPAAAPVHGPPQGDRRRGRMRVGPVAALTPERAGERRELSLV